MGRYVWFRLKDMISVKVSSRVSSMVSSRVSSRVSSKEVEYFSYGRW